MFSNFSNRPINKKVISVLKKNLPFAQMILSLASNLIWKRAKRAEFQIYKRFTLLYKIGFIYNPIFICHIPWNCRRRLYFNLKIQSFPGGDTPVPLQNFWPHKYYLRLTHSNIGKLRPWSSFSNVGWKSAILHGNLLHNTSRFHSQQQEKWMNAVTILFLKFWKSKQTGQNFSAKNAKYYKKK